MNHTLESCQAFCQYCCRVFEKGSATAAIRATEEHEKGCPQKPQPKEGK